MAATLTFTAADVAKVPTFRGRALRPAPELAERLSGVAGSAQLLTSFQWARDYLRTIDLVAEETRDLVLA